MNESYYRKSNDDYIIKVAGGHIAIKPQGSKLRITAVYGKAEAELTKVLGKPTGREAPNSMNAAAWDIFKPQATK